MTAAVKVAPVSATGKEVRDWANANGFQVPAKGKFKPEVIKAYNKANAVKYTGHHEKTVKVEGRDDRGKKVTRTVPVARAREFAKTSGLGAGGRGRLSQAVLLAAAGLKPVKAPEVSSSVKREAARAAGIPVKDRGRLPKAALSL